MANGAELMMYDSAARRVLNVFHWGAGWPCQMKRNDIQYDQQMSSSPRFIRCHDHLMKTDLDLLFSLCPRLVDPLLMAHRDGVKHLPLARPVLAITRRPARAGHSRTR